MDISKSIDFLLENASPVIKYRLRREILRDLTAAEEENYLEQIYQTPHFKLVLSYVKPNGYIGSGAHSWGKWRGQIFHETELQDGETAARLLSNYAVPKTHPVIQSFVAAMRDESTLREEFSYIPPEIPRFENRFAGMKSGGSLMITIYAMQALLGCGDDTEADEFREISYEAFRSMLDIGALSDITKTRSSKAKVHAPYIEPDTYLPCSYHLTTLAHTAKWRTPERVQTLAEALNHMNAILRDDNEISVKVAGKYYGPGWALVRPIRPFTPDRTDTVMYRRPLTEIAMLGVGERVGVLRESVENVQNAMDADGVLRLPELAKKMKKIDYPTAYVDIRLEPDGKRKYAMECELTFWAVQLLHLYRLATP